MTKTHSIQIAPLAQHPQLVPQLVRLFEAEWNPYYGPDGPGDAHADLTDSCRSDGLPIAFVALDDSGQLLGTSALKAESLPSHAHLGPWAAASVVAPPHRGRGVGTALMNAVVAEARRQGFEAIYVATEFPHWVRGDEWERLDDATSLRGQVPVYRRTLAH